MENRNNAKIQKHKAGNFLKALKGAVGQEFFQKIYFQLQKQLKEGSNLHLGFQCRWSIFITATEDALGPMANVKRLKNYLSTKEHLRGGVSLANALYKCSNVVDLEAKITVNEGEALVLSSAMTFKELPC